jgi:nicotinamidase-related amidase
MSSALVIIDVQQAILKGQLPHDLEAVLKRIEGLIAKARAERAPIIWVQHHEANTAFERGSEGWMFVQRIAPDVGDLVIHKPSSDAFHRTDFQRWLLAWGISRLVVCGYASEFCVDTTVRSAASHDLAVTLVADAHTTKDRPTLAAPAIKAHVNWLLPNLAVFRPDGKPAIEVTPAAQVVFEHLAPTFEQFSALHEAQGYAPALVRQWQPNDTAPLHSHPFAFSALMVAGEFWLDADGRSRKVLRGERFTLPPNHPHAERYGPQGATFWVARCDVDAT